MRREIKAGETHWIDIVDPSEDDLRYLRDDLGLHPLDVAECRKPTRLPKFEVHPEYLFLVIHVPTHVQKNRETVPFEFDIFVTPNAVVTVHVGKATMLSALFRSIGTDRERQEHTLGRGPAYLLYTILEGLFATTIPMLDHIVENLERAEARIFSHEEGRMVSELTLIQRDLIGFRSIIRPQRYLYESAGLHAPWDTPSFRVVFSSLHAKLIRLWEHLETLWERASALAATNAALLNHQLNVFVQVFTILGALFIPLGLVGQTLVFIDETVTPLRHLLFWTVVVFMLGIDLLVLVWSVRRQKIL